MYECPLRMLRAGSHAWSTTFYLSVYVRVSFTDTGNYYEEKEKEEEEEEERNHVGRSFLQAISV